jgi:hypothetical protein
MKRVLASALIVGVASLFGLSGCGEESKVETKTETSTPTGTTTETKTEKINQSGSNPPAPTGETAPGTPAPAETPKAP